MRQIMTTSVFLFSRESCPNIKDYKREAYVSEKAETVLSIMNF